MYASVIKNVSLKYEAGGPRVERLNRVSVYSGRGFFFYFILDIWNK